MQRLIPKVLAASTRARWRPNAHLPCRLGTMRMYASKSKVKSTANMVPGSKQPLTSELALDEYAKAEEKMKSAVDWFKKECAAVETRASGRVTPAILDPVRVVLPDSKAAVRLDHIATVGVREGSTLLITLFEEKNMKHVEQALYASKIPNIVPQKQDDRTIKIPIPRPTVEARTAAYTAATRQAEESRVQLRKQLQASLKRGKFEKRSVEMEEFHKLLDKYIAEIDKNLLQLKKATAAK
ncbi:hypothetical protein PTI98_003987 [Pleurotus ostreatus]|nr:hypothetical protein PTI98_003987 [Pleurotus ostreatus]